MALAFLDHALFGYDTPEELFEQRIPEGDNELPLRWRDEALERCIVRNISGNTVTEDPLTKESFSPLFRQVANNAGYFVTPTIHAMRRSLGKQINSRLPLPFSVDFDVEQKLTTTSRALFICNGCPSVNTERR